MTYLHTQKPPIIHRDLKPVNIRITLQGQAILVDFGIAKIYDPKLRTTMGARAVSPGFSPPEQYGHGGTDVRSDVYALGATLYTALTGRTLPESVEILSGGAPPAPPAHLINPDISFHVGEAIQKAIDVDRTKRFASVVMLKTALLTRQKADMELHLGPGMSITLVNIPTGEFLMGSNDKDKVGKHSMPQHSVYLDEYWMAKFPVSVAQFEAFVKSSGYRTTVEQLEIGLSLVLYGSSEPAKYPVNMVSWFDASAFCQWASRIMGYVVRLPTEAEWEKAARGTDGRLYPWGNEKPDGIRAEIIDDDIIVGHVSPLGCYSPVGDSPYGCVDMLGSASQWCRDWYSESIYAQRSGVVYNPTGPASGSNRVIRGGQYFAWLGSPDNLASLNCASRSFAKPKDFYQIQTGFRVVVEKI